MLISPCRHEFVGTVVGAGENAEQKHSVSIGDQVTCEQVLACNECLYCRKGLRWLCLPHDIFGFHRNVNGGVCEYMVFPANAIVYKIPAHVPPAEAVYTEPLSCAVHGVERGDIQFGDCVVVSGCGPIGTYAQRFDSTNAMTHFAHACSEMRIQVSVWLRQRRCAVQRG